MSFLLETYALLFDYYIHQRPTEKVTEYNICPLDEMLSFISFHSGNTNASYIEYENL